MNEWDDTQYGDAGQGDAPYPQENSAQDDAPYDPQQAYEQPLYGQAPDDQSFHDPYGDAQAGYEPDGYDQQMPPEEDFSPGYLPPEREKPRPAVISTNLTINLICTLGSMLGVLGLFLFFADKRSQAVRRFAVQSAALLLVYGTVLILCFVLGTVLGFIPILGGVFGTIFGLAALAATVVNVLLRVQMMLRAYAGEAYVLPLIGEHARAFE